MAASLKGITVGDVKQGSYIEIGLVKKNNSDAAYSDESPVTSYDSEVDRSIKRQKKINGGGSTNDSARPPLHIEKAGQQAVPAEVSTLIAGLKSDEHLLVDEEMKIEEKSEEKSTSNMETETEMSVHSKPQSLATIGVHDLFIGREQIGRPMVSRKGKYAILKSDVLSLGLEQHNPIDAYFVEDQRIMGFIKFCQL